MGFTTCIEVMLSTNILYTDINECLPNEGRGPCAQICTNTIGSFDCNCQLGYMLSGYDCNGRMNVCISIMICFAVFIQTSMNAYLMEDWVHVHKTVPTPLDHFTAAAYLDTLCLDIPASVINQIKRFLPEHKHVRNTSDKDGHGCINMS